MLFLSVFCVRCSQKMQDLVPGTSSTGNQFEQRFSCNTLLDALQEPHMWKRLNAPLLDQRKSKKQKKQNTVYSDSPSHAHYRKQCSFHFYALLLFCLTLFCCVFTSHHVICSPHLNPFFPGRPRDACEMWNLCLCLRIYITRDVQIRARF